MLRGERFVNLRLQCLVSHTHFGVKLRKANKFQLGLGLGLLDKFG